MRKIIDERDARACLKAASAAGAEFEVGDGFCDEALVRLVRALRSC